MLSTHLSPPANMTFLLHAWQSQPVSPLWPVIISLTVPGKHAETRLTAAWILLQPSGPPPPSFALPAEQNIWREAAVIIYASHCVGQDLSHYLGEVCDESTWDFTPCLIDGQNVFLVHVWFP